MRHFFKIFLILAIGLVATSCLTFEENYTFNADGSGEMELILDISQIASLIPEGPERDSLFLIGEVFTEMEAQMEDLEGISNLQIIEDRKNSRLGISYDFADLDALNGALNAVLVAESVDDNHQFFKQEGNSIVRTNLPATKGLTLVDGIAQSLMAEMGGEEEQVNYVLESMNYEMNMDFASRVKVVYSEAEVEVTDEERQQVELKTNFNSIMKDRDALSASFVLK